LCFCEDIDATKTASLLDANRYFNLFREAILADSLPADARSSGEFELDESYFGAKRIRGKRARGAVGKTPVFGLLKRDGKVFVEVVKTAQGSN
jgi:transposase